MAVQQIHGSKKAVMTALFLILFLMFLYQFSFGIIGTLNNHFQSQLHLSVLQATFLETAFFIGYLIAPVPASYLMQKYGYKSGIMLGLIFYVVGALVFIPASSAMMYGMFLTALFIMALGAALIESGADPYVTVLGPPEHAARRINLAQAFGGLGEFAGPLIAGLIFSASLRGATAAQAAAVKAHNARGVEIVYIGVAVISAITFIYTLLVKIPDIRNENKMHKGDYAYLFQRKHFFWAVGTQFLYIAALIGIYSFFINFTLKYWHGSDLAFATGMFTIGIGCFMGGRFFTTGLMYYTKLKPGTLQISYALLSALFMVPALLGLGVFAVICLMITLFFMSTGYPTNFALATKDLGVHTKRASSIMITTVSGGAIGPLVMAAVMGGSKDYAIAFIVPIIFMLLNALYGWKGSKVIPHKGEAADGDGTEILAESIP